MTTPIFPIFPKGVGQKPAKTIKAICHVPTNNVLNFQKDWKSFAQVIVNKLKLRDADRMMPLNH